MAKTNSKKVIAGALMGTVLGVAAGLLLASKPGKKLRKDATDKAAEFYRYIAPQLKKLKHMSQEDYERFAAKAIKSYAKIRKLSAAEKKTLMRQAQGAWVHVKKHL